MSRSMRAVCICLLSVCRVTLCYPGIATGCLCIRSSAAVALSIRKNESRGLHAYVQAGFSHGYHMCDYQAPLYAICNSGCTMHLSDRRP